MFATPDDLRQRWPGAPANDGQIAALIEDATAWLAALYSIPTPPSASLAGVLRMVVCAMVKRAMLAESHEHVESINQTAGPFGQNQSFRNSEGNLFLTRAEKDLLDEALAQEAGHARGMRTVEATGW